MLANSAATSSEPMLSMMTLFSVTGREQGSVEPFERDHRPLKTHARHVMDILEGQRSKVRE